MNSTRSLRLPVGDMTIAACEDGPRDSPAIVLLPGWPQTAYAWRHVQRRLADAGYRSLALDLPGMGQSDVLPDGVAYDTGHVSDLLSAAVATAGIERFVLVGHDVGTWTAYAWATRHPAAVEKLCLTEAAVPGITPDTAFGIANAARVFQFYFNAVEGLPEILTSGRERLLLEWFFTNKSLVADAITEADVDVYAESYSRPGRMSAGFGYYRAVPTVIRQNAGTAAPSMPILALGGEGAVGEALYNAMKAKAGQTVGGSMPGVGHYIPEEAPQAFVERLLEFIAD